MTIELLANRLLANYLEGFLWAQEQRRERTLRHGTTCPHRVTSDRIQVSHPLRMS